MPCLDWASLMWPLMLALVRVSMIRVRSKNQMELLIAKRRLEVVGKL